MNAVDTPPTALVQTQIVIHEGHTTESINAGYSILWLFVGGASAGALILIVKLGTMAWNRFIWDRFFATTQGQQVETDPLLPKDQKENKEDCWRPGAPKKAIVEDTEAQAPNSWGVLVYTLLMTIPSVVGSWCWPLLLVTAFGATGSVASQGAREASHHFTVGALVVLFVKLLYDVASTTKLLYPNKAFWPKWSPFIVMLVSCIMLILDPLRHFFLDHDGIFFRPESLAMYGDHGKLSHIGKACQVLTILGICGLCVGIIWFVRLPEKLISKILGEGKTEEKDVKA